MWFCPLDGTLLQVRQLHNMSDGGGTTGGSSSSYFYCSTCPYSCPIHQTMSKKTLHERKAVDDILGGAKAWDNVDRTQTVCPSCNHQEAYYMQIQIRSADEPMSVFYKCTSCSHQWNDK
mmetsp:Transcript_46781/g.114014  ORF Transcript_46781/g.114014 Transcript_46781/m.114014 type:complete len:119 (-) Transcript_46781:317-673(-)